MSLEGNPKAFFGVMDAPLIGALVIVVSLGALFLIFQGKNGEYHCADQAAKYQAQATNQGNTTEAPPTTGDANQNGRQQTEQAQSCETEKGFAFYVLSFLRRMGRLMRRYSDLVTAIFTGVLTAFTAFLWLSTKNLWEAAKVQSDDVKTQLAIARDDFISTHRPWVSFKSKMQEPGITFSADGARFSLEFTCRNTGTTPALGVSVNAISYIYLPVISDLDRQKKVCTELSGPVDNPNVSGRSLFPGDTDIFVKKFFIPQADLDKFIADGNKIFFVVAGCVDYAFPFGAPDAHRSGFIYYIGKHDAGKMASMVAADGDLAVGGILMTNAAFAGGFFAT
jgi:hypothetical protein